MKAANMFYISNEIVELTHSRICIFAAYSANNIKLTQNYQYLKQIERFTIDQYFDPENYKHAKNKPKLAVCAYHKPDDAHKLAFQIKKLRPDYKLFFRVYGSSYCEAVIYAL